jgi:hypothetical protein
VPKPRIFYRLRDDDRQLGGVKVIYEHVDALNAAGFDAFVLHDTAEFRCSWFLNSTRIDGIARVALRDSDFVVLPEVFEGLYVETREQGASAALPLLARVKYYLKEKRPRNRAHALDRARFASVFASAAKKVVFNQGCYLTFRGHTLPSNDGVVTTMYQGGQVVAALVVSEDSERYLRTAFPELQVHRVPNAIDTTLFRAAPKKEREICFVASKGWDDLVQIVSILKLRGRVSDFAFTAIQGLPQEVVATVFGRAAIFLATGLREGFSLPPAEAMVAGCIVVGYDGLGGREFFDRDYCFPVEPGDVRSFVETVETVAAMERSAHPDLARRRRVATETIAARYSPSQRATALVDAWSTILAGGPSLVA